MPYMSSRNIPLIYWGEPSVYEKGVATVENDTKWYDVHIVLPSGEVTTFVSDAGNDLWDHCVTPAIVAEVRRQGYIWDTVSLDLIVGRWHEDMGVDTVFQVARYGE